MLDMGFIHDVRRVIAMLPKRRQTLFFSATMPREAQELADQLLTRPETVAVMPPATTAERIDQELLFVDKNDKRALLVEALDDKAMRRVLVFSRTKHGANRVAEHLTKAGIKAEAIHGNKSQNARERALDNFKDGKTRVLVATDIAARGIDIDDITHVINFDLPEVPETYVHRIGRTARAGASGFAMSFCDAEERELLVQIEKTTRQTIPVVTGHPYEPAWSNQPFRPTGGGGPARPGSGQRRPDRGPGGGGGRPGSGQRPRGERTERKPHPPQAQPRPQQPRAEQAPRAEAPHAEHTPRVDHAHTPRTGHPPPSHARDGHGPAGEGERRRRRRGRRGGGGGGAGGGNPSGGAGGPRGSGGPPR